MKKTLVIFCPAIHRGYVEFLNAHKSEIGEVYLIDPEFARALGTNPPLNALPHEYARSFFASFGFPTAMILEEKNVGDLNGKELLFANDDISRALSEKYLAGEKIERANIFLRWDRGSVHAEMPLGVDAVSGEEDKSFMEQAYNEAQNSSDWWRQVGCVIVKDGKVILKSYNKGMPGDHTPLVDGQVRDYMKAGETPEFANFIHAEQLAIARAAKEGISLKGADMYITHFPCPVCAKSVAYSGIGRLYFSEGSSVVDAKSVLEAFGVKLFFVHPPKL